MVNNIIENILNASENIICHQVNCQGVMGGGLALQLRNKWPKIYGDYRADWIMGKAKLGHISATEIGQSKFIFNLFAQEGFDNEERQTDYDALKKCLSSVKKHAMGRNFSIALPVRLGCGLAGGDWNGVVLPMIEEIFSDYPVTIYTPPWEA